MRLYLIRHAQSENNAFYVGRGSLGRRVPYLPLTHVGHQQAELLACHLAQPVPSISTGLEQAADFGLTHLYSSLMVRALTTATYVAEALNLPLLVWPEAHEVGGIFDTIDDNEERIGQPGNNRAFFMENYPHVVLPDWLGEDGWWNRAAQTREEMVERARAFWPAFLERHNHTEDRVALVTHGGFFQGLITTLVIPDRVEMQLPPEEESALGTPSPKTHSIRRVWFDTQNTSITRIDFFNGEAVVIYLNRVDHLPIELIT